MRAAPLLAAGAILLAGCTAPAPPGGGSPGPGSGAPPGQDLAWTLLPACDLRMASPRHDAVRDAAAWAALWAEACHPGAPVPEVDFARSMVIVALLGQRPSTGYEVALLRVEHRGDHLRAHVHEAEPGPRCATGDALTYPGLFAAVARVDVPVTFQPTREDRPCGGEPPPAEEEEPSSPWAITFEPPALTGRLGEVVPFTIVVHPNASAGEGFLGTEPWVRFPGNASEVNLSAAGGRVPAEALIGPAAGMNFTLRFAAAGANPEDPERFRHYVRVEGPARTVAPREGAGPLPAEVQVRPARDAADVPEGLHVAAANGTVAATYSLGTFLRHDCMEHVHPGGPFEVWAVDGERVLVGFLASSQSDACLADAEPHTPRLTAEAAVPAGPLRVQLFRHHACFCPPDGAWTLHEARVEVPGGPAGP